MTTEIRTVVGFGVALGGLMLTGNRQLNARIEQLAHLGGLLEGLREAIPRNRAARPPLWLMPVSRHTRGLTYDRASRGALFVGVRDVGRVDALDNRLDSPEPELDGDHALLQIAHIGPQGVDLRTHVAAEGVDLRTHVAAEGVDLRTHVAAEGVDLRTRPPLAVEDQPSQH